LTHQKRSYILQQDTRSFQQKLRQLANENRLWSDSNIEVESLHEEAFTLGLIKTNAGVQGKFSSRLIVKIFPLDTHTTKLDTTIKARVQLIIIHYLLLLVGLISIYSFGFLQAPVRQLLLGLAMLIATPYCTNWYHCMTGNKLFKEFEAFIKKDGKLIN
jgi:hypothetical protein